MLQRSASARMTCQVQRLTARAGKGYLYSKVSGVASSAAELGTSCFHRYPSCTRTKAVEFFNLLLASAIVSYQGRGGAARPSADNTALR